jgi:hypothetical protein
LERQRDEALAAAPVWVACSERMPDAGVEVLVHMKDRGNVVAMHTSCYGVGWWQQEDGYEWADEDVTHWMPLPAAPGHPSPFSALRAAVELAEAADFAKELPGWCANERFIKALAAYRKAKGEVKE